MHCTQKACFRVVAKLRFEVSYCIYVYV